MGVRWGFICDREGGRIGLRSSIFGLKGHCRSDDGEMCGGHLEESGPKDSLRSRLAGPRLARECGRFAAGNGRVAARQGRRIPPRTGRCAGESGGSPENRGPKSAVLQRTLGRSGRFSGEPRLKYTNVSNGLVAVLQSIHSVQQGPDAQRRRLWPKEHAIAAHGTASITDAWGVEPKAAPGGQIRETCCMSDGRIDTVVGRAVEPPWRLNGRRGGADCAKQ